MSDLVEELRAEADYHGQAVRVGSDKDESVAAAHLEELLNRAAAALTAQAEEIARLREDNVKLAEQMTAFDANVERLKACEHIAEGEPNWHLLENVCPSARAVAELRRSYERLREALTAERERCAKIAEEHPWPTQTTEALWPIERTVIAAAIRGGSDASD